MKVDFTYLNDMAEGDKELIGEMVSIFISQINEFGDEMKTFYNDGNWQELGKVAHKAKASVSIMGMNELAKDLKDLEILSSKGEETDKYNDIINRYISECNEAVSELKNFPGGY